MSKTVVYIDSCAWNYLFENAFNLEVELPRYNFSIHITREVEIEINAIPDIGCDGTNKCALKNYISNNLKRHQVITSSVFGFQTLEPDGTLCKVQVYGGFDVGTWQSQNERDFYNKPEIKQQLLNKRKTNSGLSKNQADASLAVKSLNAIVLTNESVNKKGPLKLAKELGGLVVNLTTQVKPSGLTIGNYLVRLLDS